MENILGLGIVHREHISSVDGSILETSNSASRILTVIPRSQVKETHAQEEPIQTLWVFGPSEDRAENFCIMHTECSSHCVGHGEE